jgi:cysteine desulfurase family protein (TIGR01976 family)
MNNKTLDLNFVRKQFPALKRNFIFMDNAGGSQALGRVIERINDYFLNYNVQLGGSYEVSANAAKELKKVHLKLASYINATRTEEVVVGPSTTMLLRILSLSISQQWKPGDEVIISNSDHEANVSCWTDLEKKGIVIKTWKVNPDTFEFDLGDLKKLLTSRTKLVAVVHASNILGTLNPVREFAKIVHEAGALLCVDGVAYAPHRMIDVQEWDVDFYVFSTYKVYGPHHAILYGKYALLKELDGLNHYFIGKDEIPYKLQPGNFNFELTYSLAGIPDYFTSLYNQHFGEETNLTERQKIAAAFQLIADHEQMLADKLLKYLLGKPEIKIIGHTVPDKDKRVPTISFVHEKLKSSTVAEHIDQFGIGIRWGDFYAKKIINYLGLENKDGVIRVSLVHYNTLDEVDKLIEAFETIF